MSSLSVTTEPTRVADPLLRSHNSTGQKALRVRLRLASEDPAGSDGWKRRRVETSFLLISEAMQALRTVFVVFLMWLHWVVGAWCDTEKIGVFRTPETLPRIQ